MTNDKPKCYIFDIDGTIAERTGRSPYDWSRVSEDIPHKNIATLYKSLRIADDETAFILITGRDESCRKETVEWLNNNGLFFNELFMRPEGSKDLDVSVKTAIYRNNVEPYYDVICVFEDRERVCKMWREHLGLTCLQVAEGKF